MRRRPPPTLEEPLMNLTPLIDVVFVIFVMFLVIAPLVESEEIALAPGGGGEKKGRVEEGSKVVIHVRANDAVFLNQNPVSLAELSCHLAALRKYYPHVKPQVFQDENARFGTYQMVKNAIEEAGFSEMDVILKPS